MRNTNRKPVNRTKPFMLREKIAPVFEQHVFTEKVMQKMLDDETFLGFKKSIKDEIPLTRELAEKIACAMKEWALSLGATHYTHWFQPMTGQMAEKHDSFIDRDDDGNVIEHFSASALMKGEPDASSFPSGGMRSTFEARGYTAWDPSSPAFIMESRGSKTLSIPSLFVAYNGELLDRKVPLIKSIEALKSEVKKVLTFFDDKKTQTVRVNLGVEQEFFLVDTELYNKRSDLIACGRTVYGAMPSKGQVMGDHYFGSIPKRVLTFMADAEQRLLKLGIPVKTRHNEVAPAQFEMAQLYEDVNLACDHNMLTMEVLRQTAIDHGFACLLHEKPFDGINGSGKHNNWSISADGENLFEPGKTPMSNARFLFFVAAVMRAIHKYGVAFRLATSCPGNDHRLGEKEAPPAIVSVFLGEQLDEIMDAIIKGDTAEGKEKKKFIKVGASPLPLISSDTSDRNRTSPFAFTGNKFEFRTVGSSQSVSQSNIVINIAMAKILSEMAKEVEEATKKTSFKEAIPHLLAKWFSEDKVVVNSGDNYTKEWEEEAERRGLPNLKSCVDAFIKMDKGETKDLFTSFGLFSEREVSARKDILLEIYANTIAVESGVCIKMGKKMIIPSAYSYLKDLSKTYLAMKEVGVKSTKSLKDLIDKVSENVDALGETLDKMEKELAKISASKKELSEEEKAVKYQKQIVPLMKLARSYGDILEKTVDSSLWQYPTYSKLLNS